MPKQKTSRLAKKKFKVTGAGRILRRRAMKSHLLEKKSAKRKRSFRRLAALSGRDAREVTRMLGGKKRQS
ncbi:MAG: 50S ribosomal protein L35 [Actinomycetota bacterium]|nr:50S ribosomal protein L35 [Actinomycetota bacterium]